jgi:hypothetical protein
MLSMQKQEEVEGRSRGGQGVVKLAHRNRIQDMLPYGKGRRG